MYGLYAQLRPEMGWFLLLPLFAAVILGTIGNPYGALVGALVIAIGWQVSSAFLDPAYGPAVAFVLMILVLLFRPQGRFGKAGRGSGCQRSPHRPAGRPAHPHRLPAA